jgi:hypothetical protein
MASHHKTPSSGHPFGAAGWGLTLTVCAIGAVLVSGTVAGESHDFGLLAGAAVLATVGCLVRRLRLASTREGDRVAYRRQVWQQSVGGAPSRAVEIVELGAEQEWGGSARPQ